jgi:hypothetical protein
MYACPMTFVDRRGDACMRISRSIAVKIKTICNHYVIQSWSSNGTARPLTL